MARQQLPPQIRKVEITDRRTGKPVPRYQVTVDAGEVDGKRKQRRKRFTTEREARGFLSETQAAVSAGTYVQTSKTTVDRACADWLASKHKLKPSTLRGHKTKLQAVRDVLGEVEVQALTKRHVDDLVTALSAGKVDGRAKWSPRSINYMLGLLSNVLGDQQKQGNLVRNVASLVDRRASEPKKFRTLTDAEIFKILDHDCRERHLWALALYGMRRGEIAGLRWENVDFKTGEVTVAENRVAVGREAIVGTPKSKASSRTLPMPQEVVTALKAEKLQQKRDRLALGSECSESSVHTKWDYVASDEGGEPLTPTTISFRWGKMLREIGIDHVRLHDARHSCATLMHLRGVPIAVIAAWLGHSSAAFTMATYAHSQDDALRAAGTSFR
ncbi:site-specific integrase [Gordonia sp. HY442]|uniref:tyrosine-type recombinase/integrase n=1 Tax=Gordonia zhenghanii TaxID=2911516 RepID=UPI001F2AB16F|nr:tyrosine-type recombinase/integrase [Gordonia zhenghanii]MCF8606793.1 site-specific integrase [Gordonia zhenghanii]